MTHPKIVVFDGVCNFCNASVSFIIARDPQARFCFAPAQSEAGLVLLKSFGLESLSSETFVLIDGHACLLRSDAALAIAGKLKRPWPVFCVLRWLPKRFRDWVYSLIARNRYRLFGKKELCMVPSPEVKSRFLISLTDLGRLSSLNLLGHGEPQ